MMLALYSVSSCIAPTSKAIQSSHCLSLLSRKSRRFPCVMFLRVARACSGSSGGLNSCDNQNQRNNFAGVRLEEIVDPKAGKLRLDSWISSRISGISRARVQSSIKSGLVAVNGRIVDKVSHNIRAGDQVICTISELQALRAEPEEIHLDIIYEDEHLIVVNKPPHMVVHPAPGNPTGTLVNGILHHCNLPNIATSSEDPTSDAEDISDDEGFTFGSSLSAASIRPGIVHRLDKGTSGLLVVAKDELAHTHLSEQFKQHTIHRVYISITSGVPSAMSGRIDVPIGRDVNNRIRMAAIPGPVKQGHVRHAASRYKVIEILAGDGLALVEWRLETGRTHQIRAHAKYIGIPLLGDEVYGGTKSMALSLLRPRISSSCQHQVSLMLSGLDRPCLHALALGFIHPHTRKEVRFSCPPPPDFSGILSELRKMGIEKRAGLTGCMFLGEQVNGNQYIN